MENFGSDIPSFAAVWGPGATFLGILIDEGSCSLGVTWG